LFRDLAAHFAAMIDLNSIIMTAMASQLTLLFCINIAFFVEQNRI